MDNILSIYYDFREKSHDHNDHNVQSVYQAVYLRKLSIINFIYFSINQL